MKGFTYISRKYVSDLVVSQFDYFFVLCVRACGIHSNNMIGPFDPQQQQFNLTEEVNSKMYKLRLVARLLSKPVLKFDTENLSM
jgi:hypothetical protein